MRYTESRLAQAAMPLLEDIEEDTVNFQPNYDDSRQEPVVLPARSPMCWQRRGWHRGRHGDEHPAAQSRRGLQRHACLPEDPSVTIDDLMQFIPGPDFPTGALILGRGGIRSAYHTGRGSVIMRARATIEGDPQGSRGDHRHGDPVSGEQGDARGAHCRSRAREEGRGHSDLRDESDRHGMRVVIELKRDAVGDVVLNPALSAHPHAIDLRLQHGSVEMADAGNPESQGFHPGLRRFPHRGHLSPHALPPQQGA